MAASCFNVNDPAYKELLASYNNNNILVDSIINSYQSKGNGDVIPTPEQASEMLRNQQVERELDPAKVAYYETVHGQADTETQRQVIVDVLKHTERSEFDPVKHEYKDRETGVILKSTTTAIKGSSKIDDGYLINREIGNLADRMLEAIILGKNLSDVTLEYYDESGAKKTLDVSPKVLQDIWNEMDAIVTTHREAGSVLIPQVIVQNVEAGVAGSIDVLVVRRNGSLEVLDLKTSKTSVKEKNANGKISYYHSAWPLSEGSTLLEKDLADKLTKRQQHILQVNLYSRMLEAAGFKVIESYTHRFKVDINEAGTGIEGIADEGRSENFYGEESLLADAILPEKTYYAGNPVGESIREDNYTEKSLPQKAFAELLERDIIKPLRLRLKNLSDIYRERVNLRNDSNRLFVPKAEDTIDKLQDLLFMLENEGKSGRALLAYSRFLKYAIEDMDNIMNFLADPANVNSERASGIITNASNFLATYSSIGDATVREVKDSLPPEQRKLFDELQKKVAQANVSLNAAKEQHVKYIIRSGTNQEFTDAELDEMLKEAQDISGADRVVGDLDTSTDVMLRIIAKRFKRQLLTAQDQTRDFIMRADRAAMDLVNLSPGKVVDYSFMYEVDKNGELVVIDPLSTAYHEMEDRLMSDLYDADGKWITYYEIKDPLSANPDHIEHNKKLFEKREKLKEFRRGEIIENGRFRDGDYHKYTDEFKAARNKYEYFNGRFWAKRAEVSDAQYRRFRNKYYEVLHDVTLPVRSGKGYTGAAATRTIEVVSKKYVEPRLDAVSPDGRSFTNSRYAALTNPTTDLGRAQKKFYEFYVNEMQKGIMAKLPDAYQERYKHKVPSYNDQSEMFAHIPTVPLRAIARMLNTLKRFFTDWNLPVPAVRRTKINEEGKPVATLPLFLASTFDANTQDKINKLEEELAQLKQDFREKKITFEKYSKLRNDIKEERNRLKRRPKSNTVSRDVLKAMKIFASQINTYEQKLAAEDTFLVMKEAVMNRAYYKRKKFSSAGGQEKTEMLSNAEASNTVRRLEKWFKQIYYEENYYDDMTGFSKLGVVALRKLTAASSLTYVGYNVWGNAANAMFGAVTNWIEASGGVHYNAKGINHARKLIATDYLPNKIAATSRGLNANLELVDDLPSSRTEALIRYYNMPRYLVSKDERGEGGLVPGSYWLQDGGEFLIQSTTGLAMLAKINVVDVDSGTQTRLIDAYEWDPDSRELKLKEGDWYLIKDFGSGNGSRVKFDADQKTFVQNFIYEVNKQMHGNYADEDRVAIQDHWLGAAAMQFHKWIYPSYKAHFKRRYFDENLGWYEGRVISLMNLMSATVDMQFNIAEGWNTLDDRQKANVKRVSIQLGLWVSTFIAAGMIKGLKDAGDGDDGDQDDDAMFSFKRAYNSLLFLNDKIATDLVYFIGPDLFSLAESPFPITRYVTNVNEALWKTIQYPYYAMVQDDQELLDNKEVYYQKGPRAGQLKLAKEWKDVVPALYTINRWIGFETVQSDYRGK